MMERCLSTTLDTFYILFFVYLFGRKLNVSEFNAAKHMTEDGSRMFFFYFVFTCHFCSCFVSGLSLCLLNQRYCQEEKSIFTKTFLQVVFHQIQLCMSPSFKYSVFMHNHGNFV